MPREIVIESRPDNLSSQAKQLIRKTEKHPNGIQVETCPAPECNLSTKDVKLFSNELKKYGSLGIAVINHFSYTEFTGNTEKSRF